jgi:hypothetical protein
MMPNRAAAMQMTHCLFNSDLGSSKLPRSEYESTLFRVCIATFIYKEFQHLKLLIRRSGF